MVVLSGWLDSMILEVFSNLLFYDSMILYGGSWLGWEGGCQRLRDCRGAGARSSPCTAWQPPRRLGAPRGSRAGRRGPPGGWAPPDTAQGWVLAPGRVSSRRVTCLCGLRMELLVAVGLW